MLPKLKIHTTEDGIKYILFEQNEIISDEIKANGCWNKHILEFATDILTFSKEGGVVIDIGAGIGSFTIPLALKFKNHNFRSFEPLKVIHWQLCANALLNGLYNVRTFDKIVSSKVDRIESTDLNYDSSNNHGSYSFNPEVNAMRNIVGNENAVHRYEITNIDNLTYNNVVLFKISACGLEHEVLEGIAETVEKNFHPPIILEIWNNDWYKEQKNKCLEKFKELGYKHIHDAGSHVLAFRNEEQYLICNSNLENADNLGGFKILEESNVVEDTLENQVPYVFVEIKENTPTANAE
jgi:FkbM family methyltransferase